MTAFAIFTAVSDKAMVLERFVLVEKLNLDSRKHWSGMRLHKSHDSHVSPSPLHIGHLHLIRSTDG